MKTTLIPIGNSRGVRIPKPYIEQCELEEDIEINVRANQIIIQSSKKPRRTWERAFEQMAKRGDDALLDKEAMPSRWDEEEWQWK